jgi:hypothetical protein
VRSDDEVVLEVLRLLPDAHVDAAVHPAIEHAAVGRHVQPPRARILSADEVVDAGKLFFAGQRDLGAGPLEYKRKRFRGIAAALETHRVRLEDQCQRFPACGKTGRPIPLTLVRDEICQQIRWRYR